MPDEKRTQPAQTQEKDERHEDLELPKETAEKVKGGDGWDLKQNKSV